MTKDNKDIEKYFQFSLQLALTHCDCKSEQIQAIDGKLLVCYHYAQWVIVVPKLIVKKLDKL